MIKLLDKRLDTDLLNHLKSLQNELDVLQNYEEKVRSATGRFSAEARKPKFRKIKSALKSMTSGACRCVYCEDSCGDEIEHFKPKSLYPEQTFVWDNYLLACGPCNSPKQSKFAVILNDAIFDVTRKIGQPIVPPVPGVPALINPRTENPLDFLELDLQGTFLFLPSHEPGTVEYERAKYTIEILRLNERDILTVARAEAYGSYRARLKEYLGMRNSGEAPLRVAALKNMGHPTVWKEMQRQSQDLRDLKILFDAAPEAMTW